MQPDEEIKLKLTCLELAKTNDNFGTDMLAIAKEFFEWLLESNATSVKP